jgi:hypothetical protein
MSVNYNASGSTPVPTQTAFTVQTYENGVLVTTGLTYSWTATGLLSGVSSLAPFTPTIANVYGVASNTISVVVTYAGQTLKLTVPILISEALPSFITATKITQTEIDSPTITAGVIEAMGTLAIVTGSAVWSTCSFQNNHQGELGQCSFQNVSANAGTKTEYDTLELTVNSSAPAQNGQLQISGWDYNTASSTLATLYTEGYIVATKGYYNLGRMSTTSWSGTLANGGSIIINHGLGYKPIHMATGTVGNINITFNDSDANNVQVYNYSGGASWTGTVYLW